MQTDIFLFLICHKCCIFLNIVWSFTWLKCILNHIYLFYIMYTLSWLIEQHDVGKKCILIFCFSAIYIEIWKSTGNCSRLLEKLYLERINHSRRECICIENTIILKSWKMTLLWWPFLNATHSYRVKQFGEKMKRWLFILGQEPTQTPFTNHNVNRV